MYGAQSDFSKSSLSIDIHKTHNLPRVRNLVSTRLFKQTGLIKILSSLDIKTQPYNQFVEDMDGPVVKLNESASARGKRQAVEGGEAPVSAFLGIPYAEPPLGELRFLPPKPLSLWRGERDCTKYGRALFFYLCKLIIHKV